MLSLYQREKCPSCHAVRRELARRKLPYQVMESPKLGALRSELRDLGLEALTVPVLMAKDQVIQGKDAIFAWLEKEYGPVGFGDPTYGLTRVLEGVGFDEAVTRTKTALADNGFGVLTEIDVKKTMKEKLDVDHPEYRILGACKPPLAHRALTAEPAIGLLLPCNVVVAQNSNGTVSVAAIDPQTMVTIVERDGIQAVADEVKGGLQKALLAI